MKVQSFGSPEKKFHTNFTKINTKCLSLHYDADSSYLFVNGKEIFKFKAGNENVNFPTQFCLWNISKGFNNAEFIILKYLYMEISMIFQSLIILLINLTF